MKKIIVSLFVVFGIFSLQSCLSDSCKIEGKWKVKNVDVTSETLSPTMVNMVKDDMGTLVYEFSNDGKIKIDRLTNITDGTYTFNASTGLLEWGTDPNRPNLKEVNHIVTCLPNEIELTQRMPADTTQPAQLNIAFTLERIQPDTEK